MVRLCEALARRGHEVSLLCRASNAPHVARMDGVRVVPLERRGGLFGGRRGYVSQVRAALDDGVDVVHVHGLARLAWWLRSPRSRSGAPLVVTAHAADELGPAATAAGAAPTSRSRRHAARIRRLLPRADLVTAPSRWFVERLAAAGAARTQVIGWGPSDDALASIPPRAFAEDGAFRVLVLARLVPAKGVSELIDAFARAFVGEPRARLVVAGDGPEGDSLVARARALGIVERVDFPGYVEGADLVRRLTEADVVAVPTRGEYETFCCAALDGAAAGRALLVAGGGALPERVEGGAGRVVVHERESHQTHAGGSSAGQKRRRH